MAEVNGIRIAVLKRTATARVTGIVRGFQYQSEFTIPTQVEEKGMTFRVTEIDDAAFRNCSALTSITIPEGIVRIGKLAFAECSSLTSITIPKTVTQIESGWVSIGENNYCGHLFTNCLSLTSIVVEEGNPRYKSIQNGNGIIDKKTNTLIAGDQTTIIPDSVTSIGYAAFRNCDALTSITIPNSVTSIGNEAFARCNKLTSVTIPNSVTSIGDHAFYYCDALTSITIPDSVTSIGDYAFYYCDALTSVTIENEEGKVAIGEDAFPGKAKITYVGKPKELLFIVSKDAATAKITGVGERFKNQSKFVIPTQVEEDGKTFRVTEIADAAFSNSSALTSITISEGVVRIGKLAFANCPRLTSITIPKTVTQIDCGGMHIGYNYYSGHLFTHCPCLTSIVVEEGNPRYKSIQNGNGIIDKTTNTLIAGDQTTSIPEDVINIGEYGFCGCKALTSITIPNSVTSIGNNAFLFCSSLTSINIPDSITSIGEDAFSQCKNIVSITVANGNTTYNSRNNCNAIIETRTSTLIVGCRNTKIFEGITSIGESAFYGCQSLTSVTIPNSVTSIGEFAFHDCDALTSITIPNSVTSIGNGAFRGCNKLTSVTIPNSVTSIGEKAFSSCCALTSITIPNSVTSIGFWAFAWCEALTSITIPNSVTSIGDNAFYSCDALTSVTIENEEGKVAIGADAFPYNTKINYHLTLLTKLLKLLKYFNKK